ncbi:unnamed protein product [Sphenostylis stenocarpa]|uniref:Uncharacterized protein n=1 Tax=Sphenostylis stenocarpa TaxID=92480 RepID=A0AA86VHP1_9FABA|nr:unnamed protein product [Sphenostylis stenocarpa]
MVDCVLRIRVLGILENLFIGRDFAFLGEGSVFWGKSGVGLRDCLEIVGNTFDGLTYFSTSSAREIGFLVPSAVTSLS